MPLREHHAFFRVHPITTDVRLSYSIEKWRMPGGSTEMLRHDNFGAISNISQ